MKMRRGKKRGKMNNNYNEMDFDAGRGGGNLCSAKPFALKKNCLPFGRKTFPYVNRSIVHCLNTIHE